MKFALRLSAPLLVAITFSFSAFGEDPNVTLMKQLYTKIGQAVGVGSINGTGETYLVLANPGILLDPTLASKINTPEGQYQLSRLLDRVIKPDWIYKVNNNNVVDVYSRIINDHEAAQVKPTAAQITEYKNACKIIYTDCDEDTPGQTSVAYDRYRDAVSTLTSVSNRAEDYRRVNQTDALPTDLAVELQQATDNLNLIGHRATIEAALAKIRTYEHIDPNAWWGEVIGRFTNVNNVTTASGRTYGHYNVYPSYPVWLDMNRTWTKLTLSQTDLEQTASSSHTSVGGGLSGGWGLWSFGADYAHEENRTYFKLDVTGYQLSMELMRVQLDRPWMDEGVFESHAWQWLPGSIYDKQQISDGADATTGATPSGVMPFLPTGLLLARRTSLSGSWSHDLQTTFNEHTSGGASIGWGPISFGGRYDSSDANSYRKATAAGNTVAWDDPQIIGFFVQILPASPAPDKCYKFASNQQPLPPECSHHGPVAFTSSVTSSSTLSKSTQLTMRPSSSALLDSARLILRKSREAETNKK